MNEKMIFYHKLETNPKEVSVADEEKLTNPQKVRNFLEDPKNRAALEAVRRKAREEGKKFAEAMRRAQEGLRDIVITI